MLKNALIVVDLQNDFCKGGPLAVPDSEAIIPVINRDMQLYDEVVFTFDEHPPDDESFAMFHSGKEPFDIGQVGGKPDTLWPVHCVKGTYGARLHNNLNTVLAPQIRTMFAKGTNKNSHPFGPFSDNDGSNPTNLEAILRKKGVQAVFVCGVATDYCVKFTALGAVKLGFQTFVLKDLCRGIAEDLSETYQEMTDAGIIIL